MKNFLIVKLSAIGDVLHALPVAYALKDRYPDCHISWVVEPAAYEILKMVPVIDELILFKKKEFRSLGGFMQNFGPLRRQLKKRRYDVSLDLQGLFKSAAITWVAGAKEKIGTCFMREGSDKISRPVVGPNARNHVIEQYLDVARALGCNGDQIKFGIEVPEREQDIARRLLAQCGMNASNPYVALVIGASSPNKRWTSEGFAKLSDWLYEQRLIPVMVGGGPREEQWAQEIEYMTDVPPVNLVGRTTLPQLAAVLQGAAFTVCGDTGPGHLSLALGTKTIMLIGPTNINRTGPYTQMENAVQISRDCRYCWKRSCPKGLDKECMEDITVDMVARKIKEIY